MKTDKQSGGKMNYPNELYRDNDFVVTVDLTGPKRRLVFRNVEDEEGGPMLTIPVDTLFKVIKAQ